MGHILFQTMLETEEQVGHILFQTMFSIAVLRMMMVIMVKTQAMLPRLCKVPSFALQMQLEHRPTASSHLEIKIGPDACRTIRSDLIRV